MAVTKYICPSPAPVGSGTFSDNLVGFQIVNGGGLTQGNFQFTSAIYEKIDRTFDTGVFSEPYTLDTLKITDVAEAKKIIEKNFKVVPNFDLAQITSFSLYGSLQKRLSSSITKVINNFPAAIQIDQQNYSLNTGYTAFNIVYDPIENETSFDVDVQFFKNPFDIDYTNNATLNIQVRPYKVNKYRNLTVNFKSYALYTDNLTTEYKITDFEPTTTLTAGTINIIVEGKPFTSTNTVQSILFKPNNLVTEQIFQDSFDEVEDYILNRKSYPKYTSKFQYPDYDSNGNYIMISKLLTWQTDGFWNLDITTSNFDKYLTNIQTIAEKLDEYKTNLLSRFLTSGSLKEFDTPDQKIEKVLQIYGRSFDETKKYIDALANMNSVNYVVGNDIPSGLLSNLAETLGWKTAISPITNDTLLNTVYTTTNDVIYPGQSKEQTPAEINFQYFRNLILNSAILYKSKGTRQSIEYILRLVGAPEQIIEFNEYIYIADQKISVEDFTTQFAEISGGTKIDKITSYDSATLFSIQGVPYTGFTANSKLISVGTTLGDYAISLIDGYPESPVFTEDYFFQKGAGWFESTTDHRSPEVIKFSTSELNSQIPVFSSQLTPFTYGQEYLDRYIKFPFLDLGYGLTRTIDNVKSWKVEDVGKRKSTESLSETNYIIENDSLAINVKNMELYLNMGQGITYDIWEMSSKYGYPIANTGLTSPYPSPGNVDWTYIDPKPNQKTFLEFAQTFYNNLINVRNRQYIFDGKTGGYPTLQYIFWKYLETPQNTTLPFNDFTYQKMVDYTLGLGDYWVRLSEQFVPATTIWNTGQKMDNSIFHRQKVAWKRQRGCTEIGPNPVITSLFEGSSGALDCNDQTISSVLPFFDPISILGSEIYNTIVQQNNNPNNCNNNTAVSIWYVELSITNTITGVEQTLINQQFFIGNGPNAMSQLDGTPLTYAVIINAIDSSLSTLYQQGLDYSFVGGVLTIYNTTCYNDFMNNTLNLDISIDVSVECLG
jgi:hypothetical protein